MTSRSIIAAKKCPDCGERSPPHFDLCWNCGATLREQPSIEPVGTATAAEGSEAIETSTAADLSEPHEQAVSASELPSSNWMRFAEVMAVVMLTLGYPALWRFARPSHEIEASDWSIAIHIPVYAAWAVLLWVLVRKDTAAMQPLSLGSTRWFRELLLALPIAACGVTLSLAVHILARNFDIPSVPIDRERYAGSSNVPLIIIFYLVAAAYEEVLFRVYLQSKMLVLLKGRVWPSILLSAALFSASHYYPLRQSLSVFAFGVFYGALFYGFRSTPRLVIAHWLENLLVVLR
jgi:membrane protease YdiL (CAAX protease family)